MKKIRTILTVALSLVVTGSILAGCGSSSTTSSNTGGTLNLFNWTEYLPKTVISEFEKKYDIKVNYTTYSSNEEMLAKIQAGGGQYDIAVASDYMVDIMKKQNLLETLDMSSIPNIKNIGSQFKNLSFDPGNKYTVPYLWGDAVIVVNTKKFPDANITSYNDIWDSKYKNSIVALNDERALIGIALKKLGYSMNEKDPAKLNKAQDELTKLRPNIKIFDSDSPKTSLINGEASIGYVWGAEAYLAEQQNKDLKTFFPKEGMYLWQDNFVIPKDAKDKKNAQLFINFILDPKVSAEISKAYPYANPNVAAQKLINQATLGNTTVYPTEEDQKIGEHLKDVGDASKLYDDIWTKFKQ
ncbi:polyamine ABC transporter substrate-binding protein [Clostridium akagii]|uniref:polyamine ABC transporter substrate-binding protein n=1 Tax=Clostridium akagii TaxID=91623 RepID=UPI00068D78AE|nr:spermidine/putrescine ABC transporter substrate-binding protein [Clostridium akagii]